jgi:catechol 2,3-dioxygenase-like lactoylglutathione lyase family enzyme
MWLAAHPVLSALDIDRTVHFYEQQFGFSATLRSEAVAVLVRDAVELHFWKCDDQNLPANTSCRIRVSDAEALYRHCKGKGLVHPSGSLEILEWGKVFPAVDPDGNQIWFFEGLPPWGATQQPASPTAT